MPELKIYSGGIIKAVKVPKRKLLLDALRGSGFFVYSPCGGNGLCGKCRVYIKNTGYVTSCLKTVECDMEIVLPEYSEARILATQYKHTRDIQLNPGKVTTLSANPFGVAIDIGTTTMVFYLVQLSTGSLVETRSALNPQVKYGADIISRINYCNTNKEGLATLQTELLNLINIQFTHFTQQFGISGEDIVKVCVSGNTSMLHIFLGVNPESLAFAPFKPVFTEEKNIKPSLLNLICNQEGVLKVLPSFSAYIGADVIAGMASLEPVPDHKNSLYIDAGTNGEIALITPDKIFCCATAAGPAFEGTNIEHGMGANIGAISYYDDQGKYKTIGDSKALGICGSGLIDIAASLLKNGQIDHEGYLDKNFVIVPASESGTSNDIYITPKDIRELQLAKSAISAGINILVKRADLSFSDIDAVYLAGGFGNYIRTESAEAIGLIPSEFCNKTIPVGNTSGTGSMLALKSIYFDIIIKSILSRIVYYELSNDEDFFPEYTMNMTFPKDINKCC